MRRGNRRRRRRGSARNIRGGLASRAWSAGRVVVSGGRDAARAAAALIRAARSGLEVAWSGGRTGRSLKRSAGLKRRVSELAGSAHARGFALWAAALITGLVCVWQHVHANELASEIGALRSRRSAVRTEIGLLEMECAGLSRRERVERYATERLGMRYPRAGEVVWLRAPESGRAVERQEGFVGGGTRNDAQG